MTSVEIMAELLPTQNEFIRACIKQRLTNAAIYAELDRLYGEQPRSTRRSQVAHARNPPPKRARCPECGR